MILGCIADDFTGASDAASFLVQGGMKTIMYNGLPAEDDLKESCDACVIALKTRTQETNAAVTVTKEAARWLKDQGAKHLYIKYCSTFDSTPKGNIGPILDALLEEYDQTYTLLCPALPVNGRIVRDGRLYVNGVPLNESPMKNHPLTPMWESEISKLMEPQSHYRTIRDGEAVPEGAKHYYLVPDYVKDEDAEKIVNTYGALPLLSGGSGLLTAWARTLLGKSKLSGWKYRGTIGPALLLAGSCSKATLAQNAYYMKQGGVALQIKPAMVLDGSQSLTSVWNFVSSHKGKDVLLYSSEEPAEVKKNQAAGKEKVAAILEEMMALLARTAVGYGFTRIIVAGGETSGAVTRGLGFSAYHIGESVAPGVPVLTPCLRPDIRLVLKSGNFGQEDFFARALQVTKK